jgi:hypothetical protein
MKRFIWDFQPICPRYFYFIAAFIIFVIAIIDRVFGLLPEEPVSHYVIAFCIVVLICEVLNLLKWIWFTYLW